MTGKYGNGDRAFSADGFSGTEREHPDGGTGSSELRVISGSGCPVQIFVCTVQIILAILAWTYPFDFFETPAEVEEVGISEFLGERADGDVLQDHLARQCMTAGFPVLTRRGGKRLIRPRR